MSVIGRVCTWDPVMYRWRLESLSVHGGDNKILAIVLIHSKYVIMPNLQYAWSFLCTAGP